MASIKNSETRKRGRPCGPKRCVIQLRVRSKGKVYSYFSITSSDEPHVAMKKLQQAFPRSRPGGVERCE